MARIAGSHHVLGVEHLLREFRHSQCPVLLTSSGGQGRKSRHEEVETRERHHVDSQFTEIGIELTGESETGGDS